MNCDKEREEIRHRDRVKKDRVGNNPAVGVRTEADARKIWSNR